MNVQTIRDDTTTLDADEVEALEDQLLGPLLQKDDAGYDEARSVWNGMIDRRPVAIPVGRRAPRQSTPSP